MKAKRKRLPVASLSIDADRFQVRRNRFAESIADNIARVGWNDAKAGEIHVWPCDGTYFILDGFSRREGIARLKRKAPRDVRCVIHDCTETEAVEVAQEMNASRAELTRTERARAFRQAYEADEATHPDEAGDHKMKAIGERHRRVADRYSGSTKEDVERELPLAWLGEHGAYLVDNDFLPVSAARSLGRFIRRSGISVQQGDELAAVYIKSGFSAHQFGAFLREAENDTKVFKQSDMFGAYVQKKVADTKRLIAELRRAKVKLEAMEARAEVFASLDNTVWRATREQRKLLAADRDTITEMRELVARKSKRLTLSRMIDDLNGV